MYMKGQMGIGKLEKTVPCASEMTTVQTVPLVASESMAAESSLIKCSER